MRGNVNGTFTGAGEDDEVKITRDSIELNDVSVRTAAPSEEDVSEKNKPTDLDNHRIARLIIKLRALVTRWFFGGSFMGKLLCMVAVNGIAVALLAASIIHYINIGSPDVEWCDGVGFLWILYALVYSGLLYYEIKKRIGKRIGERSLKVFHLFKVLSSNRYIRGTCYLLPISVLAVYVVIFPGKSGRRYVSFLGMITFIIVGFVFSKYPCHVRWRTVLSGVVLQFLIGLVAINWESGRNVLDCLSNKVTFFLSYSEEGADFVYGFLSKPQNEGGTVFAFSVLPVIFFLSFFVNILSYWGVLQWFILKISWLVKMAMDTTVCESVNAAASIFLGMAEAPLLIKSYLQNLTESEICSILCAGWSTVAGVVLAAYIKFGVKASHLISASVMSAPASLSMSKLFYPETEPSKNNLENFTLQKEWGTCTKEGTNALDAASKGAITGISIVLGIIANIIAILSFVAFVDGVLGWLGFVIGFEELSTKYIMSKIFIPISFLIGVENDSLEDVAYLIGIKTVANEFQAYQKLGEWINQSKLSKRSEILATYALCGFSNFGSIGISIGALSAIEPCQRASIAKVAFRAFVASNVVCFMTACVAGCLIE